jgi:hypothetical protein
VQKERNKRNTFSEIIMDMGKYFPCKWGRELPEKSTRGHTDFIFGIEPPKCEETLCKRREIIEIRFPR